MKPSIQFVKRKDGVKIAYSTFGDGPPLVIPPQWVTSLPFVLYKHKVTEVNVNWMKTTEIAEGVELNGKTALRTLEDLNIIGLIRWRKAESEHGSPYEWQITEETLILIGRAEIFCDLDENL